MKEKDFNLIEDVRWKQRFANFCKAYAQLFRFLEKKHLNELEEQGLVKAFEYTYDEQIIKQIIELIRSRYFPLFSKLQTRLQKEI